MPLWLLLLSSLHCLLQHQFGNNLCLHLGFHDLYHFFLNFDFLSFIYFMLLLTRRKVLLILFIRPWAQWISLEFDGLHSWFFTFCLAICVGWSYFMSIPLIQSSSPESDLTSIEVQESILLCSSVSITWPGFFFSSISGCYFFTFQNGSGSDRFRTNMGKCLIPKK